MRVQLSNVVQANALAEPHGSIKDHAIPIDKSKRDEAIEDYVIPPEKSKRDEAIEDYVIPPEKSKRN